MQPVENLEDTLFQGSAAHDAVIDDDEVVLVGTQTAIGDIIDVCCKVVALRPVADKGTKRNILPHHLY